MLKKGSVAIITPCYNGQKYLKTWFDCIMSQTYPYVEIFFVDDGSTDKSAEIVKSFEPEFVSRGYKFNYYYQDNGGSASAIQLALQYVDTDYIYLYDTDDFIYEDAVEELANFLNANSNYDMVRCNGYYSRNLPDHREGKFYTDDALKAKEHIFTSLIKSEIVNWPASYMVRTSALFKRLNDRKIYVSRYGQHMQIMLPVAYFGRCGYIDTPLTEYVLRDDSDSHKGDYERKVYMAEGYTENRIETVKMIDMPDPEKERYIEYANDACELRKLELAYECGKKDLYFSKYKKLKAEGKIDKATKRKYLRRKYKIINFWIRLKEKATRILCKR